MNSSNSYILLIEDDPAIQDSLKWVLEGEGYSLALASNGQEALDYLSTAELPALILLDIMMPVMNGIEFMKRQQLMPKLAEVPVIVITADKHVISKIPFSKKNSFLSKPLDLNVFLDLVKEYIQP